mgnify:CR=1 FL=1
MGSMGTVDDLKKERMEILRKFKAKEITSVRAREELDRIDEAIKRAGRKRK